MARKLILTLIAISCILGLVLPVVVNGQSYGIQYNLVYTPAYPGSSTTLVNKFTNSGTVPEQVTGISITSDLGTFTASSGLPLQVPVGQIVELNMTEQVPSSAAVSSHSVTASINFQYQDPSTLQWVTPNTSPLVVQGAISVTANPVGAFAGALTIIAIIGALVAVVVVLTVLLLVRRKRAQPSPMGYPAVPPPPPSPPPAQSP